MKTSRLLTIESTKEPVAQVNNRLKELRRDIEDDLVYELNDRFEEIVSYTDYIECVYEKEYSRLKRLDTFLESHSQWIGSELSIESVRKNTARVLGPKHLPKEYRAPMTYISDQMDTICALMRDKTIKIHIPEAVRQVFKGFKVILKLMTIRKTIEKGLRDLVKIKLRS